MGQPCVAGAKDQAHSAAARCVVAWWARHSFYVPVWGGPEGAFRPGAFFDAGVGEGWLAFAHARAEAHLAGALIADKSSV
jgi:hypothetical protein